MVTVKQKIDHLIKEFDDTPSLEVIEQLRREASAELNSLVIDNGRLHSWITASR